VAAARAAAAVVVSLRAGERFDVPYHEAGEQMTAHV
jgi:hypothetical protein